MTSWVWTSRGCRRCTTGPEAPTAVRRFIDAFYDRVERDELLTAFFPGGVSEEHRDHVAAWWSEVLGGPTTYTDEHGGYEAMLAHHRGLRITPEQRHRFASTMSLAADDAGLPGGPGVPGGDHRVRRVGHPAGDAQLAAGRGGRRRARAGAALGLGRGAAVRRLRTTAGTAGPRHRDAPHTVHAHPADLCCRGPRPHHRCRLRRRLGDETTAEPRPTGSTSAAPDTGGLTVPTASLRTTWSAA